MEFYATLFTDKVISKVLVIDNQSAYFKGEILSCDPGLSSLVLGYGPDQLVNKTIEQVLPGRDY